MSQDMHEHRRSGDTDDMAGDRARNAAEHTLVKGVARFIVPLMLLVIGYFARQSISRIESTQAVQGGDISQMKSDVRDLNTRLDAGVIRQVDSDTKHIDNLEQRVQVLERVVHTP